jgi:hypothetical protein
MATTPNYPVEYRGNDIIDEKKVKNLNDSLLLISDSQEVNQILDRIGVNHDPSSIILEDSYNTLFVDTNQGDYSEVWGIHKNTATLDRVAVRLL